MGRRGLWPTAGSFNRFQVTLRREQAEGTEGEGQFGNYCVSKTTPEGLPVPADQRLRAQEPDLRVMAVQRGDVALGTWAAATPLSGARELSPPPRRPGLRPGDPLCRAPATWWPERALQRAQAHTAEPTACWRLGSPWG